MARAPRQIAPPQIHGISSQTEEVLRQARQHVEKDERHSFDRYTSRHRYYYEIIGITPVVKWYRVFTSSDEDTLLYEEERLYDASNQLGVRMKWLDPNTGRVWKTKTLTMHYTTTFVPSGDLLYWDVEEEEVD